MLGRVEMPGLVLLWLGGDVEELHDHVCESMYVVRILPEEVLRSLGPLGCCCIRKHATIIELPIVWPQQVLKLRA